jgi:hypothetical protein
MIWPLDLVLHLNFEICHLVFILDMNDLALDLLTEI